MYQIPHKKQKPAATATHTFEECSQCLGTGFWCRGISNGQPFSNTGFVCWKCQGVGYRAVSIKAAQRAEKAQQNAEKAQQQFQAIQAGTLDINTLKTLERKRVEKLFAQAKARKAAEDRAAEKLQKKKELEEKWAAEKQAAQDVPAGKHVVTGTVLKIDETAAYMGGTRFVMTVKDDTGFLVWGTVPNNVLNDVNKGVRIKFTAFLEPSNQDTKFGFYKRPTSAEIMQ